MDMLDIKLMTALGDVVFLWPVPREVLGIVFLAGIALIWWMYKRVEGKISLTRRRVLVGLRGLLLLLLMVILAVPALEKPRTRSEEMFTAVVIDSSQSMSIDDVTMGGEKVSRVDAEKRILHGTDGKPGLLAKLGDQSRVVAFSFDNDLHRLGNEGEVRANGNYTNIYRSLKELDSELGGLPLASVVLLTDGNIRKADGGSGGTAEDAAAILKARGVPLHVIGLGNPKPPRDYEVVKIFSPRNVRRNSEVEIFATVRNTDFKEPFKVNVMRGNELVLSKTVQPQDGTDLQRISLKLTPDKEGTTTYKVMIPPAAEEVVTANNSKEFTLETRDERLPVLYIEGSPRLEYRFLRRVMFSDPDFRVVGLLRLAKDRFYVQGANSSEQYLQKGFPDTEEKLFAFQTVILGDIEASYFTAKQLDLLEHFVKDRGGAILMLGGVNSFGLGKYAGTPIARMLPFEISSTDGNYSDEKFGAHITEEGRKHPVMRLNADSEANRHLWDSAPQLVGITPVKGVKLGAQVLLQHEKTGQPVLAVQNYGQGRVGAFTSGGSWYWQMSMPASDEFQERFWKQFIRWLVVGAKEQLALSVERDVYAKKDPVVITATVSGKDLKPVNNAVVTAVVTDPLGNKQEVAMEQVLSQEGTYVASYVPEEEGNYGVSMKVDGWTEQKMPEAEFRVSEPLVEFNDAGLKEDVLKRMAESAGGKYFKVTEAEDVPAAVAESLKQVRSAGMEPERTPIWDSPILFGILLFLAGTEWAVRRKSGLA